MLVRPLLTDLSPEQAIRNLDELAPDAKKTILTKVKKLINYLIFKRE